MHTTGNVDVVKDCAGVLKVGHIVVKHLVGPFMTFCYVSDFKTSL